MLDVVTAVDGEEEIIQGGLHIAPLKRLHGIVVLTVCLTLRQRRVDGVLVVILAGKLLHLVAHEYLAGTDRFLQTDSLQTGASRQSHVSLTACKNSSREINLHLIESQTLALVYGNRPGKSDRVLLVSANLLLLNLLFHLIEMIAHVAPGGWFHHHILSILRAYIYLGIILIIEPDDGAQGTVHPLVLDIILDKDNLCSGLQVQFDRGR